MSIQKHTRFRHLIGLALLIGTSVWAWPVLLSLHERWLGAPFERGYAVVGMVLTLLVLQIRKSDSLYSPSVLGLLFFTLAIFLATIARAVDVILLQQVMLPVIAFSGIVAYCGLAAAWRFLLPLAMLYFAVPFWQAMPYLGMEEPWLAGFLRDVTVVVVSAAIQLTGIPAFIENDFIHLPAGVVEVAEGCSGRSYFIVAIEISLFYSIAFLRNNASRLQLVAAAAILAMIGNWLRVFLLVLIGFFSEMQSSLMQDHEAFGWLVFCLVIAPMIFLGRYFESREGSCPAAKYASRDSMRERRWVPVAMTIIVALALGISLRISALYAQPLQDRSQVSVPEVATASRLSAWRGESRPRYVGQPTELDGLYSYEDRELAVYIAHYPVQRQGHEIVHFDNSPTGAYRVVEYLPSLSIESEGVGRLEFLPIRAASEVGNHLFLYSLRVGGISTIDSLRAKILQIESLARGRTDAQAVVLSKACSAMCDEDDVRHLIKFAEVALPPFIVLLENPAE